MSQEEALAFAERLRNDVEFSSRLAEASTPKERLQMVRDAGYDLEVTDRNAIRAALGLRDLSDDDLGKAAGGVDALVWWHMAWETPVSRSWSPLSRRPGGWP